MSKRPDPTRAKDAQRWMEQVLGTKISGDFFESLKDGVYLCQVINKIKPGTVPSKFKKSKIAYVCRSNIQLYIDGCKKIGVPETDRFETRDLYDGQDYTRVVNNIFSLSAASRSISSFKGPYIGVAYAEKNERHFDEATIRKGKSAVPGWAVSGKETDTSSGHDSYGIVKVKGMEKHSGGVGVWDAGSKATDTSSGHDSYGIVKVKGMEKHSGGVGVWDAGSKATDTSSGHDSYGIVKVKGMDKHSGGRGVWDSGSKATDTSSGHDSYGIVKVKGMDKHSGGRGVWDSGSKATDTSSGHDSYGIVKVKGMDKHSGASGVWDSGSKAHDTSSGHDSYGIVRTKYSG